MTVDRPGRGDGVDDELRFHLETRTDALIAQGLTRTEARAQALREFGDLDDARAYMRSVEARSARRQRRSRYMEELVHDLKLALRRLRAAPAFAIAAVLTLALGIGANTAIFSVVNAVLLRPLPFPDPGQLYAVYSANRTAGMMRASVSPVDVDDWRAARRQIADLGGYWYADGSSGVDLTGRGDPRRLAAVFATPGFFPALGIRPVAGRMPREDELVRGGDDGIVLIAYGFWQREFGGRADAVGTALTLDGTPRVVIGVLPAELRFPAADADVFLPYSSIPDSSIPRLRQVRVLNVVARAATSVTMEQVHAELQRIAQDLAARHPENRAWDAVTVDPLADVIVGPVRAGLFVLFGAVGLVLLLACVNVAGLQLTRAMGRSREVAVRLALGARRGRLIRQLLAESLVTALAGGIAGVAIAYGLLQALLVIAAGQLPRAAEITVDVPVVLFALAVSIAAGLLFGIVPALRSSRGDTELVLRDSGRTVVGHAQHRVRAMLVVAEIAVAMMLVVGAALMARSFLALVQQDPGFRAEGLVAVQFTVDADRHSPPTPPPPRLGAGSPYARYAQQVVEKVRTLPGVIDAAAVKDAPLRGNGERNGFRIPGRVVPAGEDPPSAAVIHVGEGYFRTLGASIDGREFTAADAGNAPLVVMANEAFARQFFPNERAVGKALSFGQALTAEIIGVVGDIRQTSMSAPVAPTLYLHNLQNSRVKTTVVARTERDPAGMAEMIRQAIWSIDPQQAITATFTFDESVNRALARPRLIAVLLGAFGVIGLALGAVGIYGVLSALVSERRREIGVRLALGAHPARVTRMILLRGLGLTAAGIAVGLAGAAALGGYIASVLFGVAPIDPPTFGAMAMLLLATAALSSWWPARRAARLDPAQSLRD
jgi:predicted permease